MSKERILIIEDDADVAELLVMFFTSQKYDVYHADAGSLGIALARSKLPNMILLDIMLPDMDGFQVCTTLRSNNLTKYIPTIFLTQRNAQADKVSGLELGADDYLTKPFDIEELSIRVEQSIARATRDHLHEDVTGLPTGPLVESEFNYFKQSQPGWARLDIKMNGFSAFRDAYGFLTGNEAISMAAKILTDGVIEYGTDNDFMGVLEPGVFTIFTYSEQLDLLINETKQIFAKRVQSLYKFTDVEQGYVVMHEGTDSEEHIPLMHFAVNTQTF